MAIKTFTTGEVLTASDTNTYLANAGLVYITSATVGSGVPSVTVSSCFSSTYDNYRIVISGIASSASASSLRFQLNNSTGSTYSGGGLYASFGSTTINGYGPAATTLWTDFCAADTTSQAAAMDLFAPFLTARTMFLCNSVRTGGTSAWYMMTGQDTSTASNTGFTITPISGTLTGGTITVYGYRKA